MEKQPALTPVIKFLLKLKPVIDETVTPEPLLL